MGMFNTLITECPFCGTKGGIQTKSGSRMLKTFHFKNAPVEEYADVVGQRIECDSCGKNYHIEASVTAWIASDEPTFEEPIP